ncbi:MAG: hypothetical protein N2253_07545 [Bacteroidia bacterium]|nr:hypothetical protein [Bacteroidia bacterium]
MRHNLLSGLLVGLIGSLSPLYATHLMGGEITYQCIGPNQYRIRVKLYRDCGGIELEDPILLSSVQRRCFHLTLSCFRS